MVMYLILILHGYQICSQPKIDWWWCDPKKNYLLLLFDYASIYDHLYRDYCSSFRLDSPSLLLPFPSVHRLHRQLHRCKIHHHGQLFSAASPDSPPYKYSDPQTNHYHLLHPPPPPHLHPPLISHPPPPFQRRNHHSLPCFLHRP
ncbi:unnamed protein product [Lactuca saligna]|uniref:Uncharacterized protein n=1 Tax=Lactuca saligna TaxID=75948 RepID=A0AA35VXR0_LACSI|nr:unnamed protein product [Lactuca saligna]